VIAGVAFYATNMTTNAKTSKVILSIIQEIISSIPLVAFPVNPKSVRKGLERSRLRLRWRFCPMCGRIAAVKLDLFRVVAEEHTVYAH
jgi:hypothetical protein